MKFDHTNTTTESYDPDSKVVRSNQTVDRGSSDNSANGGAAISFANALPGAAQTVPGR